MTLWACVREYANGKWMNKFYPEVYRDKSQADSKCVELNKTDVEDFMDEYWIAREVELMR